MKREDIVDEFTQQSAGFNASPAMRSEETLGRLIELVPAATGERWLDAACGPGLVARSLAPRVAEVCGVDLTPAMIELARREAERDNLANIAFATGDITRLEFDDATFDGAVTRFSLHHIPLPERVLEELGRVVKPSGWVVVADHLTAEDLHVATWHHQLERLRDPTHWACLTAEQLHMLGERSGLRLVREEQWPFALDYEEWLSRGSTGTQHRTLIERVLAQRTDAPSVFSVTLDPAGIKRLNLTYGAFVWQRPPP